MRVLVTGASGFIGSHLCERLLADGHEVVGVDRHVGPNLAGVYQHERFRHEEVDLAEPDALFNFWLAKQHVDAVIHCAARAGMSASWSEFPSYLRANVQATGLLLQAMTRANVRRLVYLSSSSVYGRYATGDEGSPTCPVSPYGVTKLAGEHLCRAYAENGDVDLTVIRPFSVYGPRQRPDMFYHLAIRKLLLGEPITIYGDGLQKRSSCYVADLVDGIVRCLDVNPCPSWTFNVGGQESVTLLEILDVLKRLTGRPANLTFGPAQKGDQRETAANCESARLFLGWQPRTPLADGLAAQVEWQRTLYGIASESEVPA